ncbi:MAG: hypothetical protein QOG53_820 [Frankiales bacterium]|jgi:hypothetical protein|nr:hypothetical protein [Frankiales bacterium]
MSATAMKISALLLVLLGILAIAAGVVYFVEAARDLPSFFPGSLPSDSPFKFHRRSRGAVGMGLGVLLVAAGAWLAFLARRERLKASRDY